MNGSRWSSGSCFCDCVICSPFSAQAVQGGHISESCAVVTVNPLNSKPIGWEPVDVLYHEIWKNSRPEIQGFS